MVSDTFYNFQSDEQSESKTGDTVNISKLSESIARATCIALVPLLDLLATANLTTIAVRATIHPENVSKFSTYPQYSRCETIFLGLRTGCNQIPNFV